MSNEVVITAAHIKKAKVIKDQFGRPAVTFDLTKEGGDKFAEFTKNNINERAAIILNGKVTSAPVIRGVIRKRGLINGDFTEDEAKRIAKDLSK